MRLLTQRVASLRELESEWSIDDICDANDALDAIADAEHEASKPKET